MIITIIYQREIFEVTWIKSIETSKSTIFMQCQADECVSYLLIIDSWTQQITVNSEYNIIFNENDRNILC